uniref:Armadillo like helical domain containing 3 n=1 Tax=Cyprinus carpio TaxID=7962 RepID=A0A8C1M150_CYPCA
MYDEIFAKEDPTKNNPRFWDELFLMKVNLEYLEGKLESLDGDEVMKIKDNINSLFHHCVQALGEEHQIKVVNALQTLCALFRGVHQKNKSATGFDIINMLMGFDKAELRMKELMESLDSLLCGDGSESLKSLCLKLLLCLVTVTDNISQNTILEYVMINSIFEAILQILSDVSSRAQHGYDAVVLLALLVNYRKYESVNPYIVKLSIVDDEPTLDGMGMVIHHALTEYNRQYKDKEEENQGGFFSTLTSMVGSMFIADADEKLSVQTNEAILLALYEAVHLNRNFITVLAQSHPEIDMATTPATPVPDQYADAFLHDDNMNFRVNLHRMVRVSQTAWPHDTANPLRPLVCAVLDLMVEFIITHMMKEFPMDLYVRCIQIIHKLICYQKKCRVRMHYTWRELWSGMIFTVFFNFFKLFFLSFFVVVVVSFSPWHLAIINHFNPKIESYAAVNHISQLSEDQVTEYIHIRCTVLTDFNGFLQRTLTFSLIVRSISLNVRKNVSLSTMSQDVLLKEFSSIS